MKIRWSALWIFVGVLGLLAVTLFAVPGSDRMAERGPTLSQAQTASSHQADEQSEQEAPLSVAVLPFASSRRAGKVLLISRDVSVAVDISPAIAGKAAIAKSAAKLTASLVPVLVAADFN